MSVESTSVVLSVVAAVVAVAGGSFVLVFVVVAITTVNLLSSTCRASTLTQTYLPLLSSCFLLLLTL